MDYRPDIIILFKSDADVDGAGCRVRSKINQIATANSEAFVKTEHVTGASWMLPCWMVIFCSTDVKSE